MNPNFSIQSDIYWQSAEKLSSILKHAVRVAPDDERGLSRIDPRNMRDALVEMCKTLAFMETDEILYQRIRDSRDEGPAVIRDYLHRTGMNIDALFARFLQFEEAVNRDTKINYDFGLIMMDAVRGKRPLFYDAFLHGKDIDVDHIKANVASVRHEVCRIASTYVPHEETVGGFIYGRLLTIAGLKVSVNNLALTGALVFNQSIDLAVGVGGYMSEMAAGVLMMFPWLKDTGKS